MGLLSLIKIAMTTPTNEGIYAPSRDETEVTEMDMKEFLEKYADSARGIQVSRDADGKSNPTTETAYGYGFNCWLVEATKREVAGRTAKVKTGGRSKTDKRSTKESSKSTITESPGWHQDGSHTTPSGITYTSSEMENAAYSGADFSIDNSPVG